MNEITGAQLTSDLIYAEYDKDDMATVNGERYLRMPCQKTKPAETMDLFMHDARNRQESEITGYSYFKFNMLSWRIVAEQVAGSLLKVNI